MTDSAEDKHKKKQQKLKEKVDAKVAEATEERGVLIVITGNGKGKSTSGFGTVTRCVGHGHKAGAAQFIKGTWDNGEKNVLEKLGVEFHVMGTGFTWNTQDRAGDIAAAKKVWKEAKRMLADPELYLVLLDELTYMLSYGYLDKDEVLTALKNRPEHQTAIVTGRGAITELRELADTVSEVKDIKHAFRTGVKARQGIDW